MDSNRSSSPTSSMAAGSESAASSTSSIQDMDQIKQAISDYLDAAADGSFATLGSLPDAVNPGLLLKGIGKIGLPLTERDAKAIIQVSCEPPANESTKKNINRCEHETYEIPADQVELRNPRWSKTVRYAVRKSVEQLGVLGGESSVRADLHKILLHEGGRAPSIEHEKHAVSGKFGTLVMVLPSEHEGGKVTVRLGKQKCTLSIPEPREFSYSYMAWYADAEYSVEPVCSGSRLALMYNLIFQSGDINAARSSSILNNNIVFPDSALKSWKARLCDYDTATEKLVYLFDSHYTQQKLGLQSLEGSDQVQTLRLYEACQEHSFFTFLGQLEHTSHRNGYDEDEEDEDQYSNLTKLYTMDGVCIAESVDIEQDDFIQSQPFEDETPDKEECDEWLDEGGTVTETYKRSCVVIVPSEHLEAFLHKASRLNVSDWTQALLERIGDEGSAKNVKNELLRICSLSTDRKTLSSSDIDSLVSAALQLNTPSIMISAVQKGQWGLNSGAIRRFGQAMTSREVTPWLPAIATGIGSMRRLTLRLDAVKLFQNTYDTALNIRQEPAISTKEKAKDTKDLKRCLVGSLAKDSLQIFDGDDNLLIEAARSHGESFVSDVMLPLSKSVIRNTDFIANICSMLSEEANQEWLSAAVVRTFVSDVVNVLAHAISDHCALQAANESKTARFQPTQASAYSTSMLWTSGDLHHTGLSWQALSALLCLCEKLELYDPVPKLLQPIIGIARSAGVGDHTEFLIPLLQSFSRDLAVIQHSLQHFQALFQEILQSLIKDYVGVKPTPSGNWSREKTKNRCCGSMSQSRFTRGQAICDDCSALNDFLVAPDRSEWRLQAAEPRRKHLDRQNYGLDFQSYVDRSEKPFTLVVTKTGGSYRNTLNAWQGRCRSLIATWDDIGQEKLKMMLGEKHDAIVEMYEDVTTGKDTTRARVPLEPIGELKLNGKRERESGKDTLPEKRAKKVDIIDLSEA